MCFVLYSKWQFSDDRGLSQGKWHPFGLCMRVTFFAALFTTQHYPSRIDDYILAGVINIILFEIGINIIALKHSWKHVGTTSRFDRRLGKAKWWIYFGLLAGAIIFKILSYEGGGKI